MWCVLRVFTRRLLRRGCDCQRSRSLPRKRDVLEINQIQYYDNKNVLGCRTSLHGFNFILLKPCFCIPYVFHRVFLTIKRWVFGKQPQTKKLNKWRIFSRTWNKYIYIMNCVKREDQTIFPKFPEHVKYIFSPNQIVYTPSIPSSASTRGNLKIRFLVRNRPSVFDFFVTIIAVMFNVKKNKNKIVGFLFVPCKRGTLSNTRAIIVVSR